MATGRVPTTANSPLTAKGDLFGYSTTQARVAVGNDGETLVADSSATTGLRYQGNYAAGKNKIINGDFNIWQRGTSFSTNGVYNADRFYAIWDGTGTKTISQQTFTPGAAPVSGYESQYYLRFNQTVAGASGTYNVLSQKIEDVRTFAGQTATLSFWAKAGSAISMSLVPYLNQGFGSGGSGTVSNPPISGSAPSLTTSWQRFTFTYSLPSITGKTIGTSSSLNLEFFMPLNTTFTIDIWGVQVEAGSVATAFQTATGTIQGELAACQRYYFRTSSASNNNPVYTMFGAGYAINTGAITSQITLPVSMRVAPTALDTSAMGTFYWEGAATGNTPTTVALSAVSQNNLASVTVSKTATFVTGSVYWLFSYNTQTAFLGFSAEL